MNLLKKVFLAALTLVGTAGWAQEPYDGAPADILPYANPNYSLLQPQAGKANSKNARNYNAVQTGKRPDHWNNILFKSFVPRFNQDGGSCGSAAAVRYMFTAEVAAYYDWDASDDNYSFPSHFTWLTTYSHSDKRQIMRHVGVPTAAVYGGRTYSRQFGAQDYHQEDYGWMQGYDKWYSAMFNRLQNAYSIPLSVQTEEGREALKNWLWNHNGDTDFVAGGIANIGVASGLTQGSIPATATNKAIGVNGKKYVVTWGETYDHSLTIAGYDDRIEFDLDGDGVFGEVDEDEVGAWIIVNSWGSGWANQGMIYCPYKYAGPWLPRADKSKEYFKPVIYYIRKDYRPLRTFKILMDYSKRSEIALQIGVAQDTTATQPEIYMECEHFRYSGKNNDNNPDPEVPMLGMWVDGMHYEPMEFGYDATDLTANFDRTKPLKYFFIVKSVNTASGEGQIYDLSIMDYELSPGLPFETSFGLKSPVKIKNQGGTTMLSVVVPGERLSAPRNLKLNGATLAWEAPDALSMTADKYYVYADNELVDSTTATTYEVPAASPATYEVAACYAPYGYTVLSPRSNAVACEQVETVGDNDVYTFENAWFTVPHVFEEYMPQATIEFWIKVPSTTRLAQDLVGGLDGFGLQLSAAKTLSMGWDTNKGNRLTSAGSITANRWTHVAVVVDRNTITSYLNASRKGSFTSLTHSGMPALGELNFGSIGLPLNCVIDEVRIWRGIRSTRELLYNRMPIANPKAHANLLACFKMDTIEENGQVKLRDCARGHHATIVHAENAAQSQDNTFLTASREPVATFAGNKTVYPGQPAVLTSDSYVTTTSWTWQAPEAGVTDYHGQTLSLVFDKPGKYAVTHTTTDYLDVTATVTDSITVLEAPMPVADFTIKQDTLPAGDVFSFINRSQADGCAYIWTIEGADAPEQYTCNATATFNATGVHNVTLTARNATGESSVTKQVYVTRTAPLSRFETRPGIVLKGEKVYLVDKSRYEPTSWNWLLSTPGAKFAVIGRNSSFTPTVAGWYDVTLTTVNSQGRSEVTQKKSFIVANADSKNGLTFDGEKQWMTFGNPFTSATRLFTFEWWMRATTLEQAFTMRSEGGVLDITTDAKGVMTVTNAAGATITSGEGYVLTDGWHHYALVYSSGRITFYRDGEKQTGSTNSMGLNAVAFSGDFKVGGFKGSIDEFRVWGKGLSQALVQRYANAPIVNVDSVETADALLLYYDFNHDQGDAIDRTSGKHDGVRSGFGPDGDAWSSSIGVFTLNFDASAASKSVAGQYLTNYKQSFASTGESINSSSNTYMGLVTGTENSAWVMENASEDATIGITTGFCVVKSTGLLACRTGYNNFEAYLNNHKLYQTITLPAGLYTLSVNTSSLFTNNADYRLVVNRGPGLPDLNDVNSAIANEQVTETGLTNVSFILAEETEVSVGILANTTGNSYFMVSAFDLLRQDITVTEADGLTNIYDAVSNGAEAHVKAIPGGVRVIYDDVTRVTIHTAAGECVWNELMSGVKKIKLPAGIYIVNGTKVSVK